MKLLSQIFTSFLILLLVGGSQFGNGIDDARQSTQTAVESEVLIIEEQVNSSVLFSQTKGKQTTKKGLAQSITFPIAVNILFKPQSFFIGIKRVIAYCCYLL